MLYYAYKAQHDKSAQHYQTYEHDIHIYKDNLLRIEQDYAQHRISVDVYNQQRAEHGRRILALSDDTTITYHRLSNTILYSVLMGAIMLVMTIGCVSYYVQGGFTIQTFINQQQALINPEEQALKDTIKINPDDAELWYRLARIYASKYQLYEAYDATEKSLNINPNYIEGWFLLLSLEEELHHNSQTLTNIYKQILSRAPTNSEALWGYAMLALRQGLEGSIIIQRFDAAFPHMPQDDETQHLVAQTKQMLQNLDKILPRIRQGRINE